MTLLSRKSDVKIVEAAAENAKKQYKDISGRDVKYSVDGSLADNMLVRVSILHVSSLNQTLPFQRWRNKVDLWKPAYHSGQYTR